MYPIYDPKLTILSTISNTKKLPLFNNKHTKVKKQTSTMSGEKISTLEKKPPIIPNMIPTTNYIKKLKLQSGIGT